MTEVSSSNREHWAETASKTGKLGVTIHKIWGNWRKSKGLGILVGEEDVKGEARESELSVAKAGPLSQPGQCGDGKGQVQDLQWPGLSGEDWRLKFRA